MFHRLPTVHQLPHQILQQQLQPLLKTYTVVSGDTLIKIANQHGISLAELKLGIILKVLLIYPGNVFNVSKPSTLERNRL